MVKGCARLAKLWANAAGWNRNDLVRHEHNLVQLLGEWVRCSSRAPASAVACQCARERLSFSVVSHLSAGAATSGAFAPCVSGADVEATFMKAAVRVSALLLVGHVSALGMVACRCGSTGFFVYGILCGPVRAALTSRRYHPLPPPQPTLDEERNIFYIAIATRLTQAVNELHNIITRHSQQLDTSSPTNVTALAASQTMYSLIFNLSQSCVEGGGTEWGRSSRSHDGLWTVPSDIGSSFDGKAPALVLTVGGPFAFQSLPYESMQINVIEMNVSDVRAPHVQHGKATDAAKRRERRILGGCLATAAGVRGPPGRMWTILQFPRVSLYWFRRWITPSEQHGIFQGDVHGIVRRQQQSLVDVTRLEFDAKHTSLAEPQHRSEAPVLSVLSRFFLLGEGGRGPRLQRCFAGHRHSCLHGRAE